MRTILFAALLAVSVPASFAAEQYWTGDRLLECLIGKGAVEIRHGETAEDAIVMVRQECFATSLDPNDVHDVIGEFDGDFIHLGVYVDMIHLRALNALKAIEASRAL